MALEMTSLLAGEKPVYNQKANDFYYAGASQADSGVRSFYTDAAVAAVAPPKLQASTEARTPAAQRLELTTGVAAAPASAPAPTSAPPGVPSAAPPRRLVRLMHVGSSPNVLFISPYLFATQLSSQSESRAGVTYASIPIL